MRDRLDELLGDPAVVAVGECGLDYYRERASQAAQAIAFAGQVELAERHRQAARDPHARGRRRHARGAARRPRTAVVLHCFSLPEHLDEVVERGWYASFAGNVTYPSATALADAARRVPAELLLLETDCPYLSPVPLSRQAQPPALRARDAARGGRHARRRRRSELAAQVEANAARVFALP